MIKKSLSLLLIGGALTLAACNAVRGAGQDLQSAADCTENAINGGKC